MDPRLQSLMPYISELNRVEPECRATANSNVNFGQRAVINTENFYYPMLSSLRILPETGWHDSRRLIRPVTYIGSVPPKKKISGICTCRKTPVRQFNHVALQKMGGEGQRKDSMVTAREFSKPSNQNSPASIKANRVKHELRLIVPSNDSEL